MKTHQTILSCALIAATISGCALPVLVGPATSSAFVMALPVDRALNKITGGDEKHSISGQRSADGKSCPYNAVNLIDWTHITLAQKQCLNELFPNANHCEKWNAIENGSLQKCLDKKLGAQSHG